MVALSDAKRAPIAFDEMAGDAARKATEFQGVLGDLVAGAAGSSPYLARLINTQTQWLISIADADIETGICGIYDDISDETRTSIDKTLRVAKARMALVLALADLGGVLPTMTITRHLTEFADYATSMALKFGIAEAVKRGKLPDAALGDDFGGLFALAMGKQGAYELNYSSDIDLILLFDETRWEDHDLFSVRKGFIRAAQTMVKILADRNADGYVFRTDLRLRPDPSVTPVVMATDQAESYYEALGRTWERAAYIKARPCAGDIAAGDRFIEALRPFVWRRYLDFAAIEDAHNMRLRIRSHKGLKADQGFKGRHLKLGRGGIREIEFFAQTRQLIFGGRDPELRVRGTLEALALLRDKGVIAPEFSEQLHDDYIWLRDLEHRTQMIEDQQTHMVPEGGDALERYLGLVGAEDGEAFALDFEKRTKALDTKIEDFFEGTRPDIAVDRDREFEASARDIVENWLSLPALRTERSRLIFERLKPNIFAKMAGSVAPNQALDAFDRFLRNLPSGVQVFSLFDANPALLDLLVEICTIAPAEARALGSNARIFEGVLMTDFFAPLADTGEQRAIFDARLQAEFSQGGDYEDALNAARRFTREAHFQIAVHLLRDLVTFDMASRVLAMIAETVIAGLLPFVSAEILRRHGTPPGRGAVVLAMGKLGSREMTLASDLDLIVIYDADGVDMSEGKRPLSASAYYAKFTQTLISALTAPTGEGGLFEVDLRLRPSGNQGPVATSLQSFRRYQTEDAWIWEHMALLRARVVAGPLELTEDVEDAICIALSRERPPQEIIKAVGEMRARLAVAKSDPSAFALKHGRGRLMDIELFTQGMTLISGAKEGGQRMKAMLADLGEMGAITPEDAESLCDTHHLFFGLQQLSRLSFAGDPPQTNIARGWLERQSDFSGVGTADELAHLLRESADVAGSKIDAQFPKRENDT